jgi:hypothetical protein
MFWSLSTGAMIGGDWTRFQVRPSWHNDVLRGLDYLGDTGIESGERVAEVVALRAEKQDKDRR